MTERVIVPRELLWEYKEAPNSLLWRLQRIADFFPACGTDRNTVRLLYKYRDKLKLEQGKYKLVGVYHEVWHEVWSEKTRERN